jgi:hypothetical protein
MSETKAKQELFNLSQRQKKLQSIFLQNRKSLEKKHSIRQLDEVEAYLQDKSGLTEVPRQLVDQLLHPTHQHFPGTPQIILMANLADISCERNMRDILRQFPSDWTPRLLQTLFDPNLGDACAYGYCALQNIVNDFHQGNDLRAVADTLKINTFLPGFFSRGTPWEFQYIFLSLLTIFLTHKILPNESDDFRQFIFDLNGQPFDRPELSLVRIQIVVQVLTNSQDKLDVLSISDRAFREAIAVFNQFPWPEEVELVAVFKLISIAVTEFGDPSKVVFFITQEINFEKTLGLFLRSTLLQRSVLAFYTNILIEIPSLEATPVVAKVARRIYDNSLTCSFQGNLALKLEAVACLGALLYRTSPETAEKELGDPADLLRCVTEQLRMNNTDLSMAAMELLEYACLRFESLLVQLRLETELHDALHLASQHKSLQMAEKASQILLNYFK